MPRKLTVQVGDRIDPSIAPLDAAYADLAADERCEAEALAWIEGIFQDEGGPLGVRS
jgi:hypothetical protein